MVALGDHGGCECTGVVEARLSVATADHADAALAFDLDGGPPQFAGDAPAAVVVAGVGSHALTETAKIGRVLLGASRCHRRGESRQEQAHQQGDDRDHDHQFNEGKTSLVLHFSSPVVD